MAVAFKFENRNNNLENPSQEEIEEDIESDNSEDYSSSSSIDEDEIMKPPINVMQYMVLFILLSSTIAGILYYDTRSGGKGIFSKAQIKQFTKLTPRFNNAYKLITNKTSDLYEVVESTVINIFSLGVFYVYYLYESLFVSFSQ